MHDARSQQVVEKSVRRKLHLFNSDVEFLDPLPPAEKFVAYGEVSYEEAPDSEHVDAAGYG